MNTASHSIAALDLGSNSFHMVIADVDQGRLRTIDRLKEMVRLGEGLSKGGSLSEQAQARALACLTRFQQRLRGIPRDQIRVVGTNALRGAKGAGLFLKQIEDVLGVPVEVIAGREEARLIYMGVANQLTDTDRRNLVVDIGGGSTEFIIGRKHQPLLMESRPMGCISYTKAFFADGVIDKECFDRALAKVGWMLQPYRRFFKRNWDVAIGTSGTAKSIAAIIAQMDPTSEGITRKSLQQLKRRMLTFDRIEDLSLPGLKDERCPVFPGGLAILLGVFKAFEIEEMEISYRSLRDGVLLDLIGRKESDQRLETVDHMMDFYRVDRKQASNVRRTALTFLPQVASVLKTEEVIATNVLGWAANLHEIGLAVAHPDYHRHGAYILFHGDMSGFSRREQQLLSFLVLNHRKSLLKRNGLNFERKPDWALLFVLRLAVIFHRERLAIEEPKVVITWKEKEIELALENEWVKQHPLTRADLVVEQRYWAKNGYHLVLAICSSGS